MPTLLSRWFAVQAALVVTSALLSRRAHAEDPAGAVALTYHVDDTAACAARSSFERRIEQMTPKATFVPEGAPHATATLQVSITGGSDAKYTGLLVYRDSREGPRTERHVSSRTCEPVVRALALVAALAIDPDAHTNEIVDEPTSAPPPLEPPAPPPAPTKPPVPTRRPSPLRAPATPPARVPVLRTFGVHATLASGRAPQPMLGARLSFDLQRARADALVRAEVGAQLDFASSRPFDGALAQGHFDTATLGLRTCPLGVRPLSWVDLGACVGARVGAAFAEGARLDRPTSDVTAWVDGIVSSRLRLGGPVIAAELSLGLAAHPVRPRYYRELPLQTIYQVPWLGFDGALGAAVNFP